MVAKPNIFPKASFTIPDFLLQVFKYYSNIFKYLPFSTTSTSYAI